MTCVAHGRTYCLDVDCRMIERAAALARIFEEHSARRAQQRADVWARDAKLGHTGDAAGGYTITARGLGTATATKHDGTTVELFAPVPLA